MARITVEDCLEKVGDNNRFRLVHLAVARIKQRRDGAPELVTDRKNKEVVMALREIAAGEVTFDNLQDIIRRDEEIETDPEESEAGPAAEQND